jgi:hypothetical protein
MKNAALLLFIPVLASSVAAGYDQSTELDQANRASSAFAAALKSELMSAMQSGGALEAIEVCNTRAVPISEKVSLENSMNLSRVSLKNRNPSNAANAWQTKVLNSFETRKKAGEAPAMLDWHQIADTENGREFRFMKAIPTGGLCLQCHGTAIAPELAEKLSELYPEDKATGYSQGDIRGAFVVTRYLDR